MKIKTIMGTLVASLLVLVMSTSVFAASGINENEQEILDALSATVTSQAGGTYKISDASINAARNYFLQDGIEVNDVQAAEILGYIEEARALGTNSNMVTRADLEADPAFVNAVVLLAQKAGAVMNLEVTVDTEETTWGVRPMEENGGTDGNGSGTVTGGGTVVKQTGITFTASVLIVFMLLSSLIACAVYVRKNHAKC